MKSAVSSLCLLAGIALLAATAEVSAAGAPPWSACSARE